MADTAHPFTASLKTFAAAVTERLTSGVAGEPEEQLRGPFEGVIAAFAAATGRPLVAVGETLLDRIGKPDYAITERRGGGLLVGHVELKAAGGGVRRADLDPRSRKQFDRFKALPNLLYSDGNSWALYRSGELVGRPVVLAGDVREDGAAAVGGGDAADVWMLLADFMGWEPQLPPNMTAKQLAKLLAPLCRLLRDEVAEALARPASPMTAVAARLRTLLFPDADDAQVADAYAQTVTFALLLARAEGAELANLAQPVAELEGDHLLLGTVLKAFTEADLLREVGTAVGVLQRVVGRVTPDLLHAAGPGERDDPWLYFYEDFLAEYDRKLRNEAGAYYTPLPVVRCQVRIIDALLRGELGRPHGFADAGVVTLDPAAGTGTYLLAAADHALARVKAAEGAGAVPGRAATLAGQLHGFEFMVGPYAVAQLRLTLALAAHGVPEGSAPVGVYLTDTLADPFRDPPAPGFFERAISAEGKRAQHVKGQTPVLVCLGNPPYDFHAPPDVTEHHPGGWVYFGDDPNAAEQPAGIFRDVTEPARAAGHGGDLKLANNLYVYFWRWAVWKVFQSPTAAGPGIASFITASSYLGGDAFVGLRELMRRECDRIDIIDLGGDGFGTRPEQNVFAIRTPVAIAVCWRSGAADRDTPATVRYVRIRGDRDEKLAALDALGDAGGVDWKPCPDGWHDPFLPVGVGDYFTFPLLTDLFPWQHSGGEIKRTWPIAGDDDTLRRRWRTMLASRSRGKTMGETRDRTAAGNYTHPVSGDEQRPIALLPDDAEAPGITPYAFRAFDRQKLLLDGRINDYPRPPLWRSAGGRQLFFASSLVLPLGEGPGITATTAVPDRHYFCGRGGKDIIPLYRDAAATESNVLPGLLGLWGQRLGRAVSAEDAAAYVYGLLAHGGFTARFWDELETREVRVPLTADAGRFDRAAALGRRLLWFHTYGERFNAGRPRGITGAARCERAVSADPQHYPAAFGWEPGDGGDDATGTLWVGEGDAGGRFAPVSRGVWEYSVSRLEVVRSWLGYRMPPDAPQSRGRQSSPLDKIGPERWTAELTSELLALLHVLEGTLALADDQAAVLADVVAGPLIRADELPAVPPGMRKAPAAGDGLFADLDD